MQRIFRLLIVLCCAVSVWAQDSPWYLDKEIKEIKIFGLEQVKARDVRPIFEEFIGEPFTEERFLLLQSKLYALDYFQEIIPSATEFEGSEDFVQLEFRVTERPVVSKIEVRGIRKLSRIDITNEVTIKNGDFISQTQLRADERKLQGFFIAEGFPNGTATIHVEDTVVVITVDEGNEFRVEDIRLYGVEKLAAKEIFKIMETKKKTGLRKGLYQAPVFEGDKGQILNLYRSEGFIDAIITDTIIDSNYDQEKDREMLTISIFIEEGSRFLFGGIEFTGNTILTQTELDELISLKKGDILDEEKLSESLQRVADAYYSSGFVFNEFNTSTSRRGNYVNYEVAITEKDRAHVDKISITGNERTKDSVILREITQKTGAIFNTTDLRQTYFNLASLDYFSVIDIQTPVGEADGLVDLAITLEEKNTIDLQFGLSFGASSEFPISLFLQLTDRNFLGQGFQASANTVLSQINQTIQLSFLTRYIKDIPISAGVSFSFEHNTVGVVSQDSIAPFTTDIPDPFTGEYVFASAQTVNGISYTAGEKFPGSPAPTDISNLNLLTDYYYADSTNTLNSRSSTMTYESYDFGLYPSVGYSFPTRIGRIIPKATLGFALEWVDYDDSVYRPANEQTRRSRYELQWLNSLSLSIALDGRNIRYNPTDGYYVQQKFTLTGGFLGGSRTFITAETRGDYYYTLFDWKVAEAWSWKMVLAIQTNFTIILPHFFYPGGGNAETEGPADSDLLVLNGIFNARGWPAVREGIAIWNSFIELRMPLVEEIIWWDFFLEGAALWRSEEELLNIELSDMLFTFGGGIRFVLPQFPLRFYFAKRFFVDNSGAVQWQRGNLEDPSGTDPGGIDFIFSIDIDFFRD